MHVYRASWLEWCSHMHTGWLRWKGSHGTARDVFEWRETVMSSEMCPFLCEAEFKHECNESRTPFRTPDVQKWARGTLGTGVTQFEIDWTTWDWCKREVHGWCVLTGGRSHVYYTCLKGSPAFQKQGVLGGHIFYLQFLFGFFQARRSLEGCWTNLFSKGLAISAIFSLADSIS
jgi:hypothetical protein